MTYKDIQAELSPPNQGTGKQDLSRRQFLQAAAAAGMVAATIPVAGMANTGPAAPGSRPDDPMEKILSRYGSELGHVTRIG